MCNFELNIEFVADYKGTKENWLFISCGNGIWVKHKITSETEIVKKISEFIDDYLT